MVYSLPLLPSFFFNDTPTTEIYTLSLHDALPISGRSRLRLLRVHHLPERPGHAARPRYRAELLATAHVSQTRASPWHDRSEEHTSELQSLAYLVCRLLLEKKKKKNSNTNSTSEDN